MPESPKPKRRGNAAVRFTLRALVGLVALAAAFGFFNYLSRTAPVPAERPADELVRPARVMTAARVPTYRRWEAFGTARPLKESTVAAQVAGTITERPQAIEPGNRVAHRDLLVKIDDTEYIRRREAARRRVESLRAQLEGLDVEKRSLAGDGDPQSDEPGRVALAEEAAEIARRDYQRVSRLAEQGSATQSEVDNARSQLTAALRTAQQLKEQLAGIPSRRKAIEADILSAQSDAEVADLNYERTEVRAPIAGQIQRVDVDNGDRVAPGSTVARIVDLSRIEVPLKLAASAATSVRVGDAARLETTGTTRQQWTGSVARIAPETDPQDRTLTVFVVVEQPAEQDRREALRPGQFLRGVVVASEPEPSIVIPRIAIRDDDTVLVVNGDGVIEPRLVEIDYRMNEPERFRELVPGETEWAAVTPPRASAADTAAPIQAGDLVVLSSVSSLRPGVRVEPENVSEPDPDAATQPPIAAGDSPDAEVDLR